MDNYSSSPENGEDGLRPFIDAATGEIVLMDIKRGVIERRASREDGLADLPRTGGKNANTAYPFPWMAFFLPAFGRVIKADLTRRESHVLYEMLKEMRYGNLIDLPHWIIADNLGIDRADVSKAVKKLVEADIIQKRPDPKDKGRSVYMLNNIVGWRGTSNDWHKTRERGNVIKADFRRNRKEADK